MHRWIACLILFLALAACEGASSVTGEAGTPSFQVSLKPYQTALPLSSPSPLVAKTTLSLPTPTAVTYVVAKGDTLSSIAHHFGVSVDAITAVNPGIQANALPLGAKVLIPPAAQGTAEALPTPASLPVPQARCWPETTGGLWCFALVSNDFSETVENISAQFTLLDSNGTPLISQPVYALLDILPSGLVMPLVVHFPHPVQSDVTLQVQLLAAIRLLPGDKRYLPVLVENTLVTVGTSGRSAQVSGRVLLSGIDSAKTIWVLASAYDSAGEVIGVRRWESTAGLTSTSPLTFDFQVASVGPAIDRVEFLAEATP